jgi:hypothetical protein
MDGEGHHEAPHEPAPPEERHLLPAQPLLLRGIGLAALAVGLSWAAVSLPARSRVLVPISLALGVAGFLSAWGSAVQLTGGVKHDDHPFV